MPQTTYERYQAADRIEREAKRMFIESNMHQKLLGGEDGERYLNARQKKKHTHTHAQKMAQELIAQSVCHLGSVC